MHTVFVDVNNEMKCGFGALASMGGPDRSLAHIVAPNIETFLQQHYVRLMNRWFFNDGNVLTSFSRDPLSPGAYGSVCVTNGLRIEAVAKYVHFYGKFSQERFNENTYFFFAY